MGWNLAEWEGQKNKKKNNFSSILFNYILKTSNSWKNLEKYSTWTDNNNELISFKLIFFHDLFAFFVLQLCNYLFISESDCDWNISAWNYWNNIDIWSCTSRRKRINKFFIHASGSHLHSFELIFFFFATHLCVYFYTSISFTCYKF